MFLKKTINSICCDLPLLQQRTFCVGLKAAGSLTISEHMTMIPTQHDQICLIEIKHAGSMLMDVLLGVVR